MKQNFKIFDLQNIFLSKKFNNKDEIFDFIASKAIEINIVSNKEDIIHDLHKREREFSTGIENGIAIPHCQSDSITSPTLLYIRLDKHINWPTLDHSLVSDVFAILTPKQNQNKSQSHLQILSKLSIALIDKQFVAKIRKQNTKENILYLLESKLNSEFIFEEKQKLTNSKLVVGITSCPVGVAHTYLAAEKLQQTIEQMGYQAKIETRGQTGPQNILDQKDIDNAEFVIIASDLEINLDPFANKKVYLTGTKNAIQNPKDVFEKAKQASILSLKNSQTQKLKQSITKRGLLPHILTGVSYMIPFVIFGGIMIALSLGIGKSIYGENATPPQGDILWYLLKYGEISFNVMIGILGGYIAYSIAGRSAIMPAMIVSLITNNPNLFIPIKGVESAAPLGFLGAILVGILIGYTIKWINTFKLPKSLAAFFPIFVIPLGITLFYALIFTFLIGAPIGYVMNLIQNGLKKLFENNKDNGIGIIASIGIGALIGAMAGFDMGGPINKIAFLTSTALISVGIFQPMGMMAAAIPVAPLGMGLATLIFKKKFNNQEKSLGVSALLMGFIGISEGAIPFAISDPKKAILSNVIGSAIAGAIAGAFGITNAAAHGGPIVGLLGAVGSGKGKAFGIGFFLISIAIGTLITALIYGLWKTPSEINEQQKLTENKILSIFNRYLKRGKYAKDKK
ncbi:PTS fructose transporter subunit IIABC [Mycoplasmopsis cricetuli]|uniref:PTS fructose transporter subunit IIABC n=1 Tax=Mycoplasmopsis cricetuli TaxID=171283 RepID=UPI000470E5C8|nr:fructose-specific PTS transporter subunit EIIC [Mycoplasmopsis cricetuli]